MKEKKKNKYQIIVRFIIVLLIVLFLLCIGFRCSYLESAGKASLEYEDDVDKITEIDYSKQQEALNAMVEEGKMNVNYSSRAVFQGTRSERFNIKNISNNHYPIVFEIYDEAQQCIYTSQMIKPGYEMNRIELTKSLDKGIHECKLKVGYAEEGTVKSVFPLTIEVK